MFDGWYGDVVESQPYPTLDPCSDFPLLTKLILVADGSTTLLLQVLAGSAISAEALPTRTAAIDDCPEAREVFGGDEPLAMRRSRLRDRTGAIVSENLITYRQRDRGALIPAEGVPFGLHTRRMGLYERRRVFRAGVTRSSFGALPARSAGRVYEIAFSTEQRVLVHEVFEPGLLPIQSDSFDRTAVPRTGRPGRTSYELIGSPVPSGGDRD
ncbi:hypothetical protein IU501_03250 [Nocardia otitidiscaviarum]|uniref:hypothetical protein n=1 Tax=Nocardia otitidiscaviarum TaxID=1823 RepID=UPI001894D39E|nr:hypothetical protein [Nocardia otitidiscaviarum]MBF6132016.1 hypothetical protein [Nocardia otitidiscaviarum]